MTLKRTLVITGDSLGQSMAGPAIRSFEIAKRLSSIAEVRLVSTLSANVTHPKFEIFTAHRKELRDHVNWAEIIIFQGSLLSSEAWIGRSKKIIVADLYDPMQLEALEQYRDRPPVARYLHTLHVNSIINRQIRRADFFLCASEKQRDFWLGQLVALGRLNPSTYDHDTSTRRLIDVVPFGVQDDPPNQTEHLVKGKIAGISSDDVVLIWGGGVYNWFDPLTLIHAVARLAASRPNLRLVFMGTKHPNPRVPAMQMLVDARKLSEELDVLEKFVFFKEGWVPYNDRANVLLDADVGVSTHLDHIETAFSFRTRILDYLWAGLPIIATRGDTFEAIIEGNGLGKVVPAGDVESLTAAIEEIAYSPESKARAHERVGAFAETLKWDKTLEPLVNFVLTAERAPDAKNIFSKNLNRLDRTNGGRLRQRFLLYAASIRQFGFVPTVTQVSSNFASRFKKTGRN
jgi:glycosyltransferase involved in cell wall biosynthesis